MPETDELLAALRDEIKILGDRLHTVEELQIRANRSTRKDFRALQGLLGLLAVALLGLNFSIGVESGQLVWSVEQRGMELESIITLVQVLGLAGALGFGGLIAANLRR